MSVRFEWMATPFGRGRKILERVEFAPWSLIDRALIVSP